MSLTPEALRQRIETLRGYFAGSHGPVIEARMAILDLIDRQLAESGFPHPAAYPGLSILPWIHRELVYDDIDWMSRDGDLQQFRLFFEIDVAIWSQGRTREELSDEAFADYIRDARLALDHRRQG